GPLGRLFAKTMKREKNSRYAFAAFAPLNASARRDLYRFPVFSCSTPLLIATSIADSVGCSKVPAAFASPEPMAEPSFLIHVRTRVRFDRFTSARWRACAARFKTDFFFFFTLVACPWAIYC